MTVFNQSGLNTYFLYRSNVPLNDLLTKKCKVKSLKTMKSFIRRRVYCGIRLPFLSRKATEMKVVREWVLKACIDSILKKDVVEMYRIFVQIVEKR